MRLSNDLNEWLRYIEAIHPQEIDLGLERLRQVADQLLSISPPFVFSVAGTNGKGTTSTAIARLCQASGQNVGLYTSPHLFRFNERIRVNNELVSDDDLVNAFNAVESARGDVSLSYFEYTTLAAFWLFEQAGLDVWVLEIGLGGRLDAVNIIEPDVCVITNVGLDHQGFLGDSVEEIGREKAGICRSDKPVVFGTADMPTTVFEVASSVNAQVYPFAECHGISETGIYSSSGNVNVTGLGLPQANAATALQAFSLSPWSLSAERSAEVLSDIQVTGRMQKLTHNGRSVVLDVGHNPHAANYIAQCLGDNPHHVLMGMLADKDAFGFAHAMLPAMASLSTISLDVPRGLSASELRQRLQRRVWIEVDTMADYFARLDRDHPGEPLFIGGSFYTVCAALQFLET